MVSLDSIDIWDNSEVKLTINNLSDTPQTYQVHASHAEDLLQFSPADQHIQVAAHGNVEVAVAVQVGNGRWSRPNQWWLRAEYDFDITVANVEVKKQVHGHLVSAPSPLFWLLILITLFAMLGCLIFGAFYTLEKKVAANHELVTALLLVQGNVPVDDGGTAVYPTSTALPLFATLPPITPTSALPVMLMTATAVTVTSPTATIVATPVLTLPRNYSITEDTTSEIPLQQDIQKENSEDVVVSRLMAYPENGTLTLNGDGTFIYTPNPNYVGTDSFTYEACFVSAACTVGDVVLHISPINDAPIADDDSITFAEDDLIRDITAQLLNGDSDKENSILSIIAVQTSNPERVIFSSAAGTVQYDPGDAFISLAAGETATDVFQYSIQDAGGDTATATVTIQIQGKNNSPVAEHDGGSGGLAAFIVNEDSLSGSLTAAMLNNDSDPDTSHQSLLQINRVDNDATGGIAYLNNGEWFYDPSGLYNGLGEGETAVDTFTYTIIDPDGAESNQATVNMTIAGINNAPTLAVSNVTSPLVFSPTVSTTNSITIASSVAITDIDSDNMGKILIQFAGSFARPDGQDEYIQITFQGNDITSTDNYIVIQSAPDSISNYITALQSTRYVNIADAPTAGCRQITFQVFDEFGKESTVETVYIQVKDGVCPSP